MMKGRNLVAISHVSWLPTRKAGLCVLSLLAAIAGLAGAGLVRGRAQETQPAAPSAISLPPAISSAPSSTAAPQAVLPQTPAPGESAADASANPRRQQINGDCADLLAMATSLKAEVHKSRMDELSVSVVRKADQVEKLAHKVRNEMKPEVGTN